MKTFSFLKEIIYHYRKSIINQINTSFQNINPTPVSDTATPIINAGKASLIICIIGFNLNWKFVDWGVCKIGTLSEDEFAECCN